jgi:hypothetical protein
MRSGGWRSAFGAVWLAVLVSRLVVWAVGVIAMLVRHQGAVLDPVGVFSRLGHAANVLVAPAARFDAVWYLAISEHGYHTASPDFFPLYPLLIRVLALVIRSHIVAGIVVSLAAFVIALGVLYRLVALDFGDRVALTVVWLMALFPMSLFFSAIYTESLFLAVSAGSIYAARRHWWIRAGLLGALASATRSVGVLLVAPLLIIYLEQRTRAPAETRPTTRDDLRAVGSVALVPAGLAAYIIDLAISRGTPLAMFDAKAADRGLAFFPLTAVDQVKWTLAGAHGRGLIELGFLALALTASVGVLRTLHRAYSLYVVLMLLVLLSEPMLHHDPLFSFPRYVLVAFPLWIWVGKLITERPRLKRPVLAASGLLLAVFTAQFATWRFVA